MADYNRGLWRNLPSIAEALHQEQYPPETGLAKVFALLRRQHGVGEPTPVADTECDTLVADFDAHLQHVAGLMPEHVPSIFVTQHCSLRSVFSAAPFDVTMVTPQAITDFVRGQAAKLKPSSCAAPATSMRVFLRFLITYCGLPAGMVGAVPTIRQWKLASLPKHLSVEEVDRTLATCEEQSPVGKRDRAILLLLVRLPLRAGEVGPPLSVRCRLERRGGSNPFAEIRAGTKAAPTK